MSKDIQAQARICPFCHDDHSAMTCYENKLMQENARLREALSKIHNLLWHCIGLTEQDNKWIQEAFKEEGEE